MAQPSTIDRFAASRSAVASTVEQIDTLIAKLTAARKDAERGRFFDSYTGAAAVNAAYDLFGCDELYDLAKDVEHDAGGETPRDECGEIIRPASAWGMAA